ncbi:efflux RND transporter permease subunit [Novipirellula artificiosorum]|uniref:MMPL family protein n=1 Tax=Novipirellula artificiosorum TaxID=2528016 RepID=A0A5C6DM23_9BACT|nr:MMPL family transporter [Novipirellula artificiosorum]TWU35909.1 MMPL family protein [Novipirellula artificiosorum]
MMIKREVSRPFVARVTERLIRSRTHFAILGLVIVAIALPFSRNLTLDRSLTNLFAADDPTLLDYQQLQQSFGGNAVAMLVYRDANLMSREGMIRNQEISQSVEGLPGVNGILSPSTLNAVVDKIRPGQFFSRSSLQPSLAQKNNAVARGIDLIFSGYTHSRNHSFAAVVAMLDPHHPPETIAGMQRLAHLLAKRYPGEVSDAVLVGEPVLINDGFDLIERDGRKLATVTLLLLSLVVLFTLLDFRFVLLTAVVVVWSVVVAEATSVAFGIHRSLVSTIMTAIVTVISVAAVLHLGVRFQKARVKGRSTKEACRRSFALLLVPIFWTCMTDAAGFAALAWSRILPVRQFGMMIAIASVTVFIAILLFAATAMMLPDLRVASSLQRIQRRATGWTRRQCIRLACLFVARRRAVMAGAGVVMLLCIIGTWNVTPETSFLNNFRSSSPIVVAYEQVEKDFGGAGVWDIVLPAPSEWTRDYFKQVIELENRLRQIDANGAQLTKVLSMADADLVASLAPLLRITPPSVRLSAMRIAMSHFVDALLTEDSQSPKMLRIMLRSEEQLPAEQKTELIRRVQQIVAEHTSTKAWQEALGDGPSTPPRVTGYYVLMSRLVAQLVGDQWRCLLVAAVLVWLLLWMATRSLRLSLAALLPNLLPAFVVLAAAGWFGGKINMGATMIAAVSIGLTIDGSVHLLAGYRRLRQRGHTTVASATHAAGNVGVPILLATAALVIGFSVLSTSEFVPTATFGILVAATLLLGTVVNLTLLPACIVWIDKNE